MLRNLSAMPTQQMWSLLTPEVLQRCEGPSLKSLDSDENFKPQHTLYFVALFRFVAIYALFGNIWSKKCLLGSKTLCFFGQEVHYYMVNIAYLLD